jgi:hypothetical protein
LLVVEAYGTAALLLEQEEDVEVEGEVCLAVICKK